MRTTEIGACTPPCDALRSQRDLVLAAALAPLLRAVRVPDRHSHDRDGRVHTPERDDARNSSTRSHDHLAADLLAQDPIRRADVAGALRRHGRGLQSEAVVADRGRGLVDDAVGRGAAALERQVEARQLKVDADDVGGEDAQCLLEQLLARLVSFEDDDRLHGRDRTRVGVEKYGERIPLALRTTSSYASTHR